MLRATVTPDRFYQDEVAVPLTFTITLAGEPLDEPYADLVLVADEDEFELEHVGGGTYRYVTQLNDFNTGGDPTRRVSCYIRMDNDDSYGEELWLTDEFPIYVIQRPSENL